jgi:hypothetical protein
MQEPKYARCCDVVDDGRDGPGRVARGSATMASCGNLGALRKKLLAYFWSPTPGNLVARCAEWNRKADVQKGCRP